MSRTKANSAAAVLDDERIFSPRTVIALVLVVAGIAWITYQYMVVRVPTDVFPVPKPGGPKFIGDLGLWSYMVGFGLLLVGLAVAAHPSTPLGRGRGVVVGMLGCFLVGMLWICVFYVFNGAKLNDIWVFNDLGNYNILVGIAFMAVGFTFATKWE